MLEWSFTAAFFDTGSRSHFIRGGLRGNGVFTQGGKAAALNSAPVAANVAERLTFDIAARAISTTRRVSGARWAGGTQAQRPNTKAKPTNRRVILGH